MPLLQVRNFPQDLYDRLGDLAVAEHRTITQQTIALLEDALKPPESEKDRRARVLERMALQREAASDSVSDSVSFIREDRDR